jgi:uncharacterized protein YjbI with pentapeptide repeats/beta-lactamase regulating signal transducer with metallopeptidase domain
MQAFVHAIEPAARIAVATLFNSLWEAAVLALAVWAILRLLPNVNATTRYAAWCVALTASLLLPLATTLPQISVQNAQASTPSAVLTPLHHFTVQPATRVVRSAAASASVTPASQGSSIRIPDRVRVALPEYVALGLFGLWVLAALLLLVRLGLNLWRLEALKRDALPLAVDYRERLAQWSAADKGDREVRLCTCDGIDVPVAVGLFDSMILIPQHLLDTLSPDEIDQIMLHELGHLRRADDWTNGLQRIVQALFFFNPAILYIAQQLDLEREVACDDWVLHQTNSVRPYATCLTKMAEVTAWPHRALAAPGVFVTRRGLSVRIERLLRAGRNARTTLSFGPAGAVVAALVAMFFVLQTVAPTFAFTINHDAAQQPAAQPAIVILKNLKHAVARTDAATPKPAPRKTTLTIPAQHIRIDIPERHITVPKPLIPPLPHVPKRTAAFNVLPPNFGQEIQTQVDDAMRSAGFRGDGSHAKMNCIGCDYSKQNLSGKSFRGQHLSGADFSKSDLHNADFSNTILLGADFREANLQGANFSHAALTGCDLRHANLTGVNFDGAEMTGCDVDARSLSPQQARAVLLACRTGCDFSGANLSGQNLRGVTILGVDLSGADLRGTDFSGSKLTGVDLSGALLDGAHFNGATLEGCDLSRVDLDKVDLSGAKMTGDKLTHMR